MCENDKNNGGSKAKTPPLSPILSQVPKGSSKIFILPPEVLRSLGIAGRVGIKKVDAGAASARGPLEVASPGSGGPQVAKEKFGGASKAKKKKRTSVPKGTADKREEKESSTGDSLELKQRLSAREDELSEKYVEEESSGSKATKARRKVYAPKAANDRPVEASDEVATKDAKGKTESPGISGVRTSRRTAKPKRFDDYVATDYAIDGTSKRDDLHSPSAAPKRQSRKSYPSEKRTGQATQSRRSVDETRDSCEGTSLGGKVGAAGIERKESVKSGESAETAKRRTTLDTREISSVDNSCSPVPETFDDTRPLKRSDIVRTYTRRKSKATSQGQNVVATTTEIESPKYENPASNSSFLDIGLGKIQPVKASILKTYSNRKVNRKMKPASAEQTDKSEMKKIGEPEVSERKETTVQAPVASQPESHSGQPEITNNCEKPKTNDPRQSDKERAETETKKPKTGKSTSRRKIHCAQLSSESRENSGAVRSSIDLPLDDAEQASGSKSKAKFKRKAKKIRAGEAGLLKQSWAREDNMEKPLGESRAEIRILKSPGKRSVSARPTTSSDKHETDVSRQDTPREGNDQSSTCKPEDPSSGSRPQPKPPSEMKCLPVDSHPPDEHEDTLKTATSSSLDSSKVSGSELDASLSGRTKAVNPKLETAESANDDETSTSELDTSRSRDESETTVPRLETQRPGDKNNIDVSGLEALSLGKKEAIESNLGSSPSADANATTKVDKPRVIDDVNVVAAKLYTPLSGHGKKSQIAKIGRARSSSSTESKSLPDVPSSRAKGDIPDGGPGGSKKSDGVNSKNPFGSADQSETTTLELKACTPHGRGKRPSGWMNKEEIETSLDDTPMSPDENAIVSESNVPASSDTNETIVSELDISSPMDHIELPSEHEIPKSPPYRQESSKTQLSDKNKAFDAELNIPNFPNNKETSKNDTPKCPDEKYSVSEALPRVSTEVDVMEAKLDMPNSSNEKKISMLGIPKASDEEKNSASKELTQLSNEAEGVKLDRPNSSNEKDTPKRDIPKSMEKEVIGVLSKAPVLTADERAIDTELKKLNSLGREECVVSRPSSNAPSPQDNAFNSRGPDTRSPDSQEAKRLSCPDENEVTKASGFSEVASNANPSTGHPSSRIATIVSTNSSAADVETEATERSTILEAPSGEDNPVEIPQVSPSRQKGRPRKSKKATDHTVVENGNSMDASADAVEATAENSFRMKKPVQRSADETDGKGLSDDDSDVDSNKEEIVPARRLGRPPGSVSYKGRRGRRRGQTHGRVDREYVPRVRASSDQKPETEISDAVEEQSNSDKPKAEISPAPEVECGKCKKTMSKKSWPHHNLMTHNDMGWLSDQPEPDFKNNEKLLRSVLQAVVRKKRRKVCFICEVCGDEKRSANGFISHLEVCGKTDDEREALLVTCPICGNKLMSSSAPMHERSHRQIEKSKKEVAMLPVATADLGKGKRKAAEKAATKITEFTDLIKEDEPPTEKRRRTNDELRTLVRKRDATNPPSRWRGLWKVELIEKGKAACRHPGCTFLGDTFESIIEHSSNCSCAPHVKYMCKICRFSHESEEVVTKHVKSEHPTAKCKTANEDSDFECEDDTSSQSDPEESCVDTHRRPVAIQQKSTVVKEQCPFINVGFLAAEDSLNPNSFYIPAVRWTMEFECKNYRLRLFEKLSPNAMRLLSDDEARGYLPKLETSMRIKDTKGEADAGATGTCEKSSNWITWQRFQGKMNDGTPTLFTGGPVWAVAWLTIPAVVYAEEVDQYVAVSTHPTMESVYSVGESHTGKNLIQIWNLGNLNNRKETVAVAPRFAYGVAHDNGTIWCLEWCPSGCYEHSKFLDEDRESPKRMGLLAAACSDGCVHVYSLPFINEDALPSAVESSSNDPPIYDTRPIFTLLISSTMYEKSEQNWQCTKLNWSRELGHDTIIAGFSNGYIAMWDLTSESPLFVTKRDGTTFIEAFHHFYAHSHAVSFVQLIPYGNKRFFVSASYDRATKVWDLEDTSFPLCGTKRGAATDGAWLTHWPAYLTAYDDVSVQGSPTYLMLLRQAAAKPIALLPAKSTTFTVGVSDYGNSVAHGTTAGEICVMFHQHFWDHRKMDRDRPMKRAIASTVEVVDLTRENPDAKKKKNGNSNLTNNGGRDYTYMPATYEECSNRFGIVFRRSLSRSMTGALPKRSRPLCLERLATVNVEQYPFTSANRVSWNPNAWSYLWLCVGYQNGLVRFLHFNAAKLEEESNRLLPTHAASMSEGSGKTSERKDEASF